MNSKKSSTTKSIRRQTRTYDRANSIVFLKTKELFGGLSNMAGGFPLSVNGLRIRTSEALYQACRFPHLPDLQRLIFEQRSPMTAKMKSRQHRHDSRKDWNQVRVSIMRWCLRVKLAQNRDAFGDLLLSTHDFPIVEQSRKDDFWGAKSVDEQTLVGRNILGRLLMELRDIVKSEARETLLVVEPLDIPNFLLDGFPIKRTATNQHVEYKSTEVSRTAIQPSATTATFSATQLPLSGFSSGEGTAAREKFPEFVSAKGTGPLKPYPAYKETRAEWLRQVPAHWELKRLRNVADMQVSNVDKHIRPNEISVRLCNYVDVYRNDYIDNQIEFMRATATAEEIDRFRLNEDDVLITKDSETWDDIGVPALVTEPSPDLISGYHLALLRPQSDKLVGPFLFRALQSKDIACQLHVTAKGVTRFGLSLTGVKSVWLPVPPLLEQTAIGHFLNHIDRCIQRCISAKEKLIAILEEEKQAIIHNAVTGRIDVRTRKPYPAYKPSGVKWLGDIPDHWDIRPAKWHFREVDERSDTGTEELLSVSHVTGVTPRSEKNVTMFEAESNVGHKICRPGDVVINTMWAWMAALGLARQVGIVSPSYAVYRRIGKSLLCGDYGELLLRSAPYQVEYRRLSTGIRPSRLRLYPDAFLRIRLACPPPEEQGAIVVFVQRESANNDQASLLMREQIATLQEYRERLIADVVTGKMDVREAAAALPKVNPIAAETVNEDHDASGGWHYGEKDAVVDSIG